MSTVSPFRRITSVRFRVTGLLLVCCLLGGCAVRSLGAREQPRKEAIAMSRACIISADVTRTAQFQYARGDTLVVTRLVQMDRRGNLVDLPPDEIDSEPGTILLELRPGYTLAVADTMFLPLDAIQSVRMVEVDVAGTVIVSLLGVAGLFALFVAIVALTKESCPFVYAFDGEHWVLEGEIYSGAVHPPIERDDYLRLPALRESDGQWKIRLSNEVREIQQTNLAELYVYEHEEATSVLVDKYGIAYVLRDPQPPLAAVSLRGEPVLDRISDADDIMFESRFERDEAVLDGVVLTFRREPDARHARLLLRAKNSFWLDHAFGAFYDSFGSVYEDWNEQQKSESPEKLRQWSLDQNIPLSVYLKQDGAWVLHDYFNIAGPIALRNDVLNIPLPDDGSEEVQIKLLTGRFFWEIDHVALDSAPLETVQPRVVPLRQAVSSSGTDVTADLRTKDDRYQVLAAQGEYADCIFPVLTPAPGKRLTVFLHSSGHYEAIRDASGTPDLPFLYSFRRPGRFNEFATQLFFEQLRCGQSAKSTEPAR